MKKILYLHLKGKHFDEIKAGTKPEEYRRYNAYWSKRLLGRIYDEVHVLKGYPKKDDHERRLIFPWRGYCYKLITHSEFGIHPVTVYAIKLTR